MAQKKLNTRISWRRDTDTNWISANPVLLNGEIIIVDTDDGNIRFKIGDGSKTYTQLPFEDEAIRNLIDTKSVVTLETWNNADNADSSITIGNLTINKIKSKEIYDAMRAAGKVDENELYLVEDENPLPIEITTSLTTGVEIGTIAVNGNIYTLYAPDSIATVSTQADLFENDPTSDAYVKNRIFGYYTDDIENIFPLTTIPTPGYDGDVRWNEYDLSFDYEDAGKEYVVTFDNVQYPCVLTEGGGTVSLGYWNDNYSNYPFILWLDRHNYGIEFIDETVEHTLQIDYRTPVKLTSNWIESATPDSHALTHMENGSDPITPNMIGAATTATVTATSNGLMLSKDKAKLDAVPTPENIITTTTIFDSIMMKDQINGMNYIVCMQNGNLVSYSKAVSITLVTPPNKMTYAPGEYLDTTGMVINAVCEDGSTREITNYVCNNYVTKNNPVFTIVYIESNIEYTLTFDVTVTEFDKTILQDFTYEEQDDETYLITGWKGTVNGVTDSTTMVVPDHPLIVI